VKAHHAPEREDIIALPTTVVRGLGREFTKSSSELL